MGDRALRAVTRVGIADHFGWAVTVSASDTHDVVDRRRIELVEPGVTPAPIHNDSKELDLAASIVLVDDVRASVTRATSVAFDELEAALPAAVESISLRTIPGGDRPRHRDASRTDDITALADIQMRVCEMFEVRRVRALGGPSRSVVRPPGLEPGT